MEGKEEDVKLGANKFGERQPLGTSAQTKDYKEAPPAPFFEPGELKSWSFYRAGIAEFMATFLFLYITVLTVMGVVKVYALEGIYDKNVAMEKIRNLNGFDDGDSLSNLLWWIHSRGDEVEEGCEGGGKYCWFGHYCH